MVAHDMFKSIVVKDIQNCCNFEELVNLCLKYEVKLYVF